MGISKGLVGRLSRFSFFPIGRPLFSHPVPHAFKESTCCLPGHCNAFLSMFLAIEWHGFLSFLVGLHLRRLFLLHVSCLSGLYVHDV